MFLGPRVGGGCPDGFECVVDLAVEGFPSGRVNGLQPVLGVVPGFQRAIAGQRVGSTVAVAMKSADGYPNGNPSAGIQPGDSLIFAIKILDASG